MDIINQINHNYQQLSIVVITEVSSLFFHKMYKYNFNVQISYSYTAAQTSNNNVYKIS